MNGRVHVCRNCQYSTSGSEDQYREAMYDRVTRDCRRHSPKLDKKARYPETSAAWPQVVGDQWCGDWESAADVLREE